MAGRFAAPAAAGRFAAPAAAGKRVDTCGFHPMIFTSFPNEGVSLEKRTELR